MEVRVGSNKIKAEREKRGWSQEHLASVAGLSLRTVQRVEKTGAASFESVTALASVLALEVADLRASETEPLRARALRLSLELPMRLALAALSGTLCALHFRQYYTGPEIGYEWFDFGVTGALFALAVLCPYLRPGHRPMMRALALIGASALSYYCAMTALAAEAWFVAAASLKAFLVASFVGVNMVLLAAKFLLGLRVTAAFWFLGLVASVAGGAAMYACFEFGDGFWTTIASFSAWHMLACIALHHGRQPDDAQRGLLADFARARTRFSILPGWLRWSQPALVN